MAINIPIVTAFSDSGIKAAEKAFGKFGKTGVAVGAAFAAVSTAVVAGLGMSVKAAAEDQRHLDHQQHRNESGQRQVIPKAFA